ncbi:MAG TPA: hypothetical protein H9694_11105 [Firmicutes bacterium]|nr:hypothetical protein [Bacillota bacterium]
MRKGWSALLLSAVCLLAACRPQQEAVGASSAAPDQDSAAAAALEESGYAVWREILPDPGYFLTGERCRLVLNGDQDVEIFLYLYGTPEEAPADAGCISPDGFSFSRPGSQEGTMDGASIDWISVPHFYLYNRAIVQYVGTDPQILSVLEALCGAPFAGGET